MTNLNHRLGSASPQQVAQASFAGITISQDFLPEAQLMSAALQLLLLSDAYKITPQEVLQYTHNLIEDPAAKQFPEFRALFDYVQSEIKPK